MRRADLLEQIVADLCGGGAYVQEGVFCVINGHVAQVATPLVGVRPRSGDSPEFVAFGQARVNGNVGCWRRPGAGARRGNSPENRIAFTEASRDSATQANVRRRQFVVYRDTIDDFCAATREAVWASTPETPRRPSSERLPRGPPTGTVLLEGGGLTIGETDE